MAEIKPLRYLDSANNEYIISSKNGKKHFRYEPMTASKSSSGDYSGGSVIEKDISDAVFDSLVAKLQEFVESQLFTEHTQMGRPMGTGLLRNFKGKDWLSSMDDTLDSVTPLFSKLKAD